MPEKPTLLQHVLDDDPTFKDRVLWWLGLSVQKWVKKPLARLYVHFNRLFMLIFGCFLGGCCLVTAVGGFLVVRDIKVSNKARDEAELREKQGKLAAKDLEEKAVREAEIVKREAYKVKKRKLAISNWDAWRAAFVNEGIRQVCYHGDNFATMAEPRYTITCSIGGTGLGSPENIVMCDQSRCTVQRYDGSPKPTPPP